MRLLDGTPIKWQEWTAPVPPMTHELSSAWEQPDPNAWTFDDKSVIMPEAAFRELREYSGTLPTGVYAGKMWKARASGTWYLVWYGEPLRDLGPDVVPDRCPIQVREILFA